MALDFPAPPVADGTVYQRWTFNLAQNAWLPTVPPSVPTLPISGGTLTGPGNLTVNGTTTLVGAATLANASVSGTLGVTGATTFADGVTIGGEDAATKDYVDQAVASGGLWQGTWDASTNTPDLTSTAVQLNGWGWTIVTPDPTAPYDVPATPVIAGVSGATVYNGDHVIWSTSASSFEIVHGSSLSLQEAEDLFVAKAGDTMTGALTIGSPTAIASFDPAGGWDPVQLGQTLIKQGSIFHAGLGGSAFWLDGNGTLSLDNGLNVSGTVATNITTALNYQGGNIRITGAGTTTATGNVTITSTNVMNGNLTLQGPTAGTGNVTTYNGNIHSYQLYGQYVYANSLLYVYNGGVNARPEPVVYGLVIEIGGTVPTTTVYSNWWNSGGGNPIALGRGFGSLVFYSANGGGPNGFQYVQGSGEFPPLFSIDASNYYVTAHYSAYKPGGGPWSTMSDARAKTDVRDYTHGLSELIRLRPTEFRYNGRGRQRETGKTFVGLAAEEAQTVMPELVHAKRGKLDYDDDEATDILHIDANAITYATINALKEIARRLEALEAGG